MGPSELWSEAYNTHYRGNKNQLALAVEKYQSLITMYPDSEEASWAKAELDTINTNKLCYELTDNTTDDDKWKKYWENNELTANIAATEQSNLRLEAYKIHYLGKREEIGDAVKIYQQIISGYPQSEEAAWARKQLELINNNSFYNDCDLGLGKQVNIINGTGSSSNISETKPVSEKIKELPPSDCKDKILELSGLIKQVEKANNYVEQGQLLEKVWKILENVEALKPTYEEFKILENIANDLHERVDKGTLLVEKAPISMHVTNYAVALIILGVFALIIICIVQPILALPAFILLPIVGLLRAWSRK